MPLSDFQTAHERETVAMVAARERLEAAEFWRKVRRGVLLFALGFLTCLLLLGCAVSPETERASRIADQQGCLYILHSFLKCPHTPEMVK